MTEVTMQWSNPLCRKQKLEKGIMISLCIYYARTTMEGRIIDKLIS
jgi:hypothetical protein